MTIIAIDPGTTGAYAILSEDHVDVFDIPTVEKTLAGKTKKGNPRTRTLVVAAELASALRGLTHGVEVHAFVEEASSRPHGQKKGDGAHSDEKRSGNVQGFTTGRAFGIIEGVLGALGIPATYVHPATWKRTMRLSKDKGASREMAIRMFPVVSRSLARKMDHNRAEALLLAQYGAQVLGARR